MKELIEWIAVSLVDHPDQVMVTERKTEERVVYELSVAKEDLGKVIGRQGRIAKAIRTVVNVVHGKEKRRVWVEIK
ncbi:KH domain-containing protein [Laceyella sacchari]|uniref:RNA-binding protein KhpA n=1 Tax=Laceyella sacchari TaxID=37482 RepID=A0ABY5TYY5_LACSH|nr:KH domain-containing protein [Laceyella sacchari]UWE02622.1 KH domain-containing protein [Laceyella sacchari]